MNDPMDEHEELEAAETIEKASQNAVVASTPHSLQLRRSRRRQRFTRRSRERRTKWLGVSRGR
ncbi:MAG: hypothetical protein KF819_19960 [Labilithrix sp.]|nr:hypothetical protein [Labilithrix sp.]